MHDPFAMRPFFGYNFGHYLDHWLSFQNKPEVHLPKIFHVNWFRKGPDGFLWPGFGENSRVLDWMFRRIDGEDCAMTSAVGLIPKPGSIDMSGLEQEVDEDALFDLSKEFWQAEVKELGKYFEEQVGEDLPASIRQELCNLGERVNSDL
jgi:phosphoenolpyruvate carboxykinase (GTP)